MSVVSEIKCVKCDRMYSGLRSKCPYCGTRRISRGKYSPSGDNSSGKILIAVLIMSVFVVATGVLLFTTDVEETPNVGNEILGAYEEDDDDNGLDGFVTLESPDPVLPTEEYDEYEDYEEDLEPLVVRSVRVLLNGNPFRFRDPSTGFDEFSFRVGESLVLSARIEPIGVEEQIIWATSDMGVFDVTPTAPNSNEATVRAVGRGNARLTVTVGDIVETVIVRVQN